MFQNSLLFLTCGLFTNPSWFFYEAFHAVYHCIWGGSRVKILSPWQGHIVGFGIGLSQRPAGLCYSCITASGSVFHQLLAASRRRRKSPNLPKGLGPPANQISNKGAPFWKGRAPQQPSDQLLNEPPANQVSKMGLFKNPPPPSWPGTSFFYLPQQLMHTPPPNQG